MRRPLSAAAWDRDRRWPVTAPSACTPPAPLAGLDDGTVNGTQDCISSQKVADQPQHGGNLVGPFKDGRLVEYALEPASVLFLCQPLQLHRGRFALLAGQRSRQNRVPVFFDVLAMTVEFTTGHDASFLISAHR